MNPERKAWVALLTRFREAANMVREGIALPKLERQELAAAVIRMRAPFPLSYASAGQASAAFLALGRGWVATDCSELTARSVAALAEDLQGMLERDTQAAFARSLRATGTDN